MRLGLASNLANLFPEMKFPVPKEIEDEANSHFQKIYNHPPHPTMSNAEFIEVLKRFQESSVPRDREIFHCMIKNLFEEYKYFPQYPNKELFVTAQLFGMIIDNGLVQMVPLGLALRFVLVSSLSTNLSFSKLRFALLGLFFKHNLEKSAFL